MALQKFLALVSGIFTEIFPVDASAGAGDAGKLVALNSRGEVDETMLPSREIFNFTASEAIAAGAAINFWDDAGTTKVRNADASGGFAKKCDGFAEAAIADAASGRINFGDDVIAGLSGLSPGAVYYLSATPGQFTDTPPSTAGHIVQRIGKAKSATELIFDPDDPVVLA